MNQKHIPGAANIHKHIQTLQSGASESLRTASAAVRLQLFSGSVRTAPSWAPGKQETRKKIHDPHQPNTKSTSLLTLGFDL